MSFSDTRWILPMHLGSRKVWEFVYRNRICTLVLWQTSVLEMSDLNTSWKMYFFFLSFANTCLIEAETTLRGQVVPWIRFISQTHIRFWKGRRHITYSYRKISCMKLADVPQFGSIIPIHIIFLLLNVLFSIYWWRSIGFDIRSFTIFLWDGLDLPFYAFQKVWFDVSAVIVWLVWI